MQVGFFLSIDYIESRIDFKVISRNSSVFKGKKYQTKFSSCQTSQISLCQLATNSSLQDQPKAEKFLVLYF